MNNYTIPSSQKEFDHIIEGFTNKTLPAKEWTHEAHLITGLWYAAKLGYTNALAYLRNAIKIYNESVGGMNTDSRGYHESITVFWVWLLDTYWQSFSFETSTFENICNDFLKSKYANREAMLQFYSREVLFSKEARLSFIEPDIQPFDFEKIA